MEHVLLGFIIFNTLLLLFIAWALHAGRRSVDRLIAEEERLMNSRTPPDPHRFGPP